MKKILVIGSPGAGKSTFSKNLTKLLNIPLYHLDLIWHKEDRTNISDSEFNQKLKTILEKEKWIIDGNYASSLELRLKVCDTVFLLDLNLDICLKGIEERVGKPRSDMPWYEDTLEDEFKEYVKRFPKTVLPKVYSLLEKYNHLNIIIFKTREDINNYLKKIRK